jgi:hypothetical protein
MEVGGQLGVQPFIPRAVIDKVATEEYQYPCHKSNFGHPATSIHFSNFAIIKCRIMWN